MTNFQSFVKKAARVAAEQVELEEREDGSCVLRFAYGKASEPFKLRGETPKEQLRDLGVKLEQFMGAR